MHVCVGSEYMARQNHTGRSNDTCTYFNLVFLMKVRKKIKIMMEMLIFLKKTQTITKTIDTLLFKPIIDTLFHVIFANIQLI